MLARQSFRRGKFDYHRARLSHAKEEFIKSEDLFWQQRDFDSFFDACSFRLRTLAERGEVFFKNDELRLRTLKSLADENLQGRQRAKALQLIALISLLNSPEQTAQAKADYVRSLDVHLDPHDRGSLAPSFYGLAFIAMGEQDFEDALRWLGKLEGALEKFPQSYFRTKGLLLKAMALRESGRPEEAQTAAWTAYSSLREFPDFVHYIHSLNMLAHLAIDKRSFETAAQYLDLARAAIRDSDLVRITGVIERATARLNEMNTRTFGSLLLSLETQTLTNTLGHELSFGGSIILRELCLLFGSNPAKTFSKEEIISRIWNEKYDSAIHDNKLYVTLQRLRRHSEKNGFLPVNSPFIVRSKNGYRLNPSLHVQLI